jgi:hypothetical protein
MRISIFDLTQAAIRRCPNSEFACDASWASELVQISLAALPSQSLKIFNLKRLETNLHIYTDRTLFDIEHILLAFHWGSGNIG